MTAIKVLYLLSCRCCYLFFFLHGLIMSSSSSDSDAGERVKNVKYLLVKSKIYQKETDKSSSYKQRLGDLIFNASFEAGNLGYAEQVDDYEYDLMIRPDIANPRHRIWFNFTVSNQLPNQCVIFTIVNLSTKIRLFHEGLTPVVRSRAQPNWTRLHEDQVFYYRSRNHSDSYVLSIAFRFSSYDNEHQFALFYPYSFTTLRNFINRWEVECKRFYSSQSNKRCQKEQLRPFCQTPDLEKLNKQTKRRLDEDVTAEEIQPRARSQLGFAKITPNSWQIGADAEFKIDTLSTSILSKPIFSLSIKGRHEYSENLSVAQKSKAIILCRMCGNLEGAASLVCQGILDYVLSESPVARVARQHTDFLIFPMLDPDSICVGNSRSDILGQTRITKKLLKANEALYSNIQLINEMIERSCRSIERTGRVIVIELKVNINLIGSRICGTQYDDSLRMERHIAFPKLLARFADDFYLESCDYSKPSKTARSLLNLHSLSNVDHYKLEVSPFASFKRSLYERKYQEYQETKYMALGKAVLYALLGLLKQKDKNLPHCVSAVLNSFQPESNDIDDLVLSNKTNIK